MDTPFPYRITVSWSAGDGAYVALCPALPGCGGDGSTEVSAIKMARETADQVLAVMRRHGDALPAPDAEFMPS